MQNKIYFFRERVQTIKGAILDEEEPTFNVSPYGGITVAIFKTGEKTFSYAIAYCNMKDKFVKTTGRGEAACKLVSNPKTFQSNCLKPFDVYCDLLLKIKNGKIDDPEFMKYMQRIKKYNKLPKSYVLFAPKAFFIQPKEEI